MNQSFLDWLFWKEDLLSINSAMKQRIPKGCYCYDGNGVCPYWYYTEEGAFCSFLNEHSERYNSGNLIWDQCKECNINRDDEDECPEDDELSMHQH